MESKRVFFMAHLCCVREMNMKQKTMKYWYIFRMKSRVEKGAWSFFCSWRSRYVSCGFFCVCFFLGGVYRRFRDFNFRRCPVVSTVECQVVGLAF